MATFLFDGDCAFCTLAADWLRRHVAASAPIVAWQHADIAALGVNSAQCQAAVQWVEPTGTSAGPAAVGALLRTAHGPGGRWWRMIGRLLSTRLVLVVAWPVYRFIARHRHQLPGGTAACALPAAQGHVR